jgi:hypothetical protein
LRASGRTVKAELKAIWFRKANDERAMPSRRGACEAYQRLQHDRIPEDCERIESKLGVTQWPERGERSAAFPRCRLSRTVTASATRR